MAAVLVPAIIHGCDPAALPAGTSIGYVDQIAGPQPDEQGHTWRWKCTCGLRSSCTFATAEEADRYGARHTCKEGA